MPFIPGEGKKGSRSPKGTKGHQQNKLNIKVGDQDLETPLNVNRKSPNSQTKSNRKSSMQERSFLSIDPKEEEKQRLMLAQHNKNQSQ